MGKVLHELDLWMDDFTIKKKFYIFYVVCVLIPLIVTDSVVFLTTAKFDRERREHEMFNIASAVKQFWEEVAWEDTDCMFIDCPPGTGDVPLTVFQTLPVDGIVVVTSPQDLVSMIVEKAVNMAKMMDIPVIGIVENMSDFKCPDCGNIHYIYGKSNIDKVAEDMGIKNVAKMPIDPHVAEYIDAGRTEELDASALDTIFKDI